MKKNAERPAYFGRIRGKIVGGEPRRREAQETNKTELRLTSRFVCRATSGSRAHSLRSCPFDVTNHFCCVLFSFFWAVKKLTIRVDHPLADKPVTCKKASHENSSKACPLRPRRQAAALCKSSYKSAQVETHGPAITTDGRLSEDETIWYVLLLWSGEATHTTEQHKENAGRYTLIPATQGARDTHQKKSGQTPNT